MTNALDEFARRAANVPKGSEEYRRLFHEIVVDDGPEIYVNKRLNRPAGLVHRAAAELERCGHDPADLDGANRSRRNVEKLEDALEAALEATAGGRRRLRRIAGLGRELATRLRDHWVARGVAGTAFPLAPPPPAHANGAARGLAPSKVEG